MRMLKPEAVLVATDHRLHFLDSGAGGALSLAAELPLTEAWDPSEASLSFTGAGRRRDRCLLIVPDHWFQHEFFAFQSQKDSLIKPFLERKLASSRPDLPSISDFFAYLPAHKKVEGQGLKVVFLQEEKAYRLYDDLQKIGWIPRWITTPALLWADRMKRIEEDFDEQGALLVHLKEQVCFLYFYFDGDFLFSRAVPISTEGDARESLIGEISQSLYLFSQKSKSDLGRLYLVEDRLGLKAGLEDALRRPVRVLERTTSNRNAIPGLPFIEDLVEGGGIIPPPEPGSICSRSLRRVMKWRPVQWAGLWTGVLLTALFIGEQFWLERLWQEELHTSARMLQEQPASLTEYEEVLAALSVNARRLHPAEVIVKAISCLPEVVLLNEVKMDMGHSTLVLNATFQAPNIEAFRQVLKTTADELNRRLAPTRPVRLEDVNFHIEDMRVSSGKAFYRVTLNLNLS